MASILVVDDEHTIVNTLRAYLEKEGFAVYTASDGHEALRLARAHRPDLIVLDIMLPGIDGLEVLRAVRAESDVYVLMLTAKAEEIDRIVGLTLGADDYLTKPFSPRELVARVKAILRRNRGEPRPMLSFAHIRIEPDARKAWVRGDLVELTPNEFDLLLTLAQNPGLVLSREQLIQHAWGHDYYGDDRVVDVNIGRLRKKIEPDPANPSLIVTVRGAGYRFEDLPQ
ncbi:MAG: response regulator transcription factor [Chloroflexi bacterium]|nr:response regulator transcription factor [Chloroflexota bacterium]